VVTVIRADLERLRNAMRASDDALVQGLGTRAAFVKAAADYYLALHPDKAIWRPTGAEEGIPSVEEIRERAAVADRAHCAIPHWGRTDPDPARHDAWAAQLGWAEETWRAVFTGGFWAAVADLKAGDPRGLEYGVRFLEADPWCFRSGYTKAKLIFPITQLQLDGDVRERLARVVLAVVDDPRRRREIRHYGRLARAVGTAELRAQLEQRTAATDPQVRFNARQILETWQLLTPDNDTTAIK
jgi:hypothetical protein